jgi:hypothetical protein
MMGPGHRIGAAAVVVGVGMVQIELARRTGRFEPLPVGEVVAAAALAVPFSAGRFSPDADNRGWVKRRFGHRRAVHWWGWPVAVLAVVAACGLPWPCYGPALGWLSHLFPFDFLFGKGGRSIPKGIPLWPWRGCKRLGLGLRVSAKQSAIERAAGSRRTHSLAESAFTVVLAVVLVAELYFLARAG